MSAEFFEAVETAGGVGIVRGLTLDSEKYVCFTRFSQEESRWVIGISDGILVWRAHLKENEVKELCQGKGLPDVIKDISHALEDGETQLLGPRDELKLKICYSTSKQLDLSLEQSPASQLRPQIKLLMFSLLDSLQSTKRKLKTCESEIEKARHAAESSGFGSTASSGSTTAGKAPLAKQKKTKGASLVNPSSKRRKAAKGVVFDGAS